MLVYSLRIIWFVDENFGGEMFGWAVTLMIIGGASFILPLFGRQFVLVSLVGLTGMGAVLAGVLIFVIGVVLFINSQKNNVPVRRSPQVKRKFAFEVQDNKPEPLHVEKLEALKVMDLSSFSKSLLSPDDFGKETAELSLVTAKDLSKNYIQGLNGNSDFAKAVADNYAFLLLAFSSVLMGGIYCYTKNFIGASQKTMMQIKVGMVGKLRDLIPQLSDSDVRECMEMVDRYSVLIVRELAEDKENLVAELFSEYVRDFYKSKNPEAEIVVDLVLYMYAKGLGKTTINTCRDNLGISLVRI